MNYFHVFWARYSLPTAPLYQSMVAKARRMIVRGKVKKLLLSQVIFFKPR